MSIYIKSGKKSVLIECFVLCLSISMFGCYFASAFCFSYLYFKGTVHSFSEQYILNRMVKLCSEIKPKNII